MFDDQGLPALLMAANGITTPAGMILSMLLHKRGVHYACVFFYSPETLLLLTRILAVCCCCCFFF
jgi:hypothetical protein